MYRTLQFIVFLTLRVIYTCDQCDSPFCALQLPALIKPNWYVLLYCCACLYHSLIVVQPSWITVPCPRTKLRLLISKSFVGIKQSVTRVALKTRLKTSLGICIYKTSLPHRPDDYISFTSSCPPTFYNIIAPMLPNITEIPPTLLAGSASGSISEYRLEIFFLNYKSWGSNY